jgi:ATP-dependent Lon protease
MNDYLRGVVRQSQKVALAKIRAENEEMDIDELSDKISNTPLTGLPIDLIGKLLSALREIKPSAADKSVCTAWLEVVHSCCFTISSSEQPKIGLSHLPMIIKRGGCTCYKRYRVRIFGSLVLF